jgi:polysaccharide export outer membrane protein
MNRPFPRITVVLAALASLALLMVFAGCSGGGKMAVASGQMYDREQLDEFATKTGPPAGAIPEYRIGIGDRLDVIFLFHTNLSQRLLLVRDDGRISMPYVGDQVAMGYTPMELDSILTARFSEILREPNLSVVLNTPATKQVYVMGLVNRPGGFEFGRPLSLLQSIAMAGGVASGGKPENTVLIRREAPDEVVGIEINVKEILKGESVDHDVLLKNYDIVYVPKSRLKSVEEFAMSLRMILELPLGTTLQGWQIATTIENYKFFRERRLLEVE